MSDYQRVIPRDLFNEADLLKCLGRLVIALQALPDHAGGFDVEEVDRFDVRQDESSGSIRVDNLPFTVGGVRYRLERPLNARAKWPLWLHDADGMGDVEIRVFDEEGELSSEMTDFLRSGGPTG